MAKSSLPIPNLFLVRYAHYICSLRSLYLLAWFATLTTSARCTRSIIWHGSLCSLYPLAALALSFGMVCYTHYIFLQCSLLCSPYSFAALTLYTNITHYML